MNHRYNLGDRIWILKDKKATQIEITSLRLGKTFGGFPTIYYGTDTPTDTYGTVYTQTPEDELFSSKEELIKSL